MSVQRHRIKRQIVEIRVRDAAQAERVQARMSQLQSTVIVPVIERVCSELSAPERVHRIEALEVDLGVLDLDEPEQELGARLGQALRAALAPRIAQNEQALRPAGGRAAAARQASRPAGGSAAAARQASRPAGDHAPLPPGSVTAAQVRSWLELLAVFARTGTLPWWADASEADCVQESLRALLDRAPAELIPAMRDLAREPRALQRIASIHDDAVLAELFAALATVDDPASPGLPGELLALLRASSTMAGVPRWRLRTMSWQCLLRAASLAMPDVHELLKDALARFATMAGIGYDSLLHDVYQGIIKRSETATVALRGVIEQLYREVHGQAGASGASAPRLRQTGQAGAPEHQLARAGISAGMNAGTADGSGSPRLRPDPAGAHDPGLDRPGTAQRGQPGSHDQEATAREPVGLDQERPEQVARAHVRLSAATDGPAAALSGRAREAPGTRAPALRQTRETDARALDVDTPYLGDSNFIGIEELYILNSGIVILWPF